MSGPRRDLPIFVFGFSFAAVVTAFAVGLVKLPAIQEFTASLLHGDLKSNSPVVAEQQPDACPGIPRLTSRDSILALLKRPEFEKDQFENSTQYTSRIKKLLEPLGTVTVAKSLGNFGGRYDADTGTLVVDPTGLFDDIFDDIGAKHFKWYEGIPLSKTKTLGGTYMAQNAFGVSRKVTVSNEEHIDVVVRIRDDAAIGAKLKMRLSPARAKAVQGNLCVVLTGVPTTPYKLDDTTDPRPTINDPTEMHVHDVGLVIGHATGEIVDVSTGAILLRFDPTMIK